MSHIYIIAEAGVNHNGSLDIAKELIDVAANSGADAVKFQTFNASKIVSMNAPKAEYQMKNTEKNESQLKMIKKLELDKSAHYELQKYCKERNIDFLSTPFDMESVDFLVDKLDLQKIKIGSGEITNGPLLLHIARKNKPIILSTGMSTLGEVENALSVLAYGFLSIDERPGKKVFQEAYFSIAGQQALKDKVMLLHCTTQYPAHFNEVNLKAMDTLGSAFDLPVGYSDHTEGITIPIAAAARGASVIEKHFTLDRNLPGPDHKASLEPEELKEMVSSIRIIESAMGDGIKRPANSEIQNRDIARKSLVALKRIREGDVFVETNLGFKRPGTGISPMEYWDYLGKNADADFEEDSEIQ